MVERVRIRGGAGPYEAAAIMAAISDWESELNGGAASPPDRPSPSAWVLSGRPRMPVVPLVRLVGPTRPVVD